MRRLARQVRALNLASRTVEYDDPKAEAVHNATATSVLEAVIATRASTLAGLRMKAEALAWCYAGDLGAMSTDTTADRLLASMVRDILASGVVAKAVAMLLAGLIGGLLSDAMFFENITGTFG